MKEILLFIAKDCPYCARALRYQKELLERNARFRGLDVQIVDKAAQASLAGMYDHYYVPAYYVGGRKVHEGAIDRRAVKRILDMALQP